MDYSNWLTKQEAAEAIGCSTKTVETLAKAKKLQQGLRGHLGRGASARVYHPDDVTREAAARRPRNEGFLVPAMERAVPMVTESVRKAMQAMEQPVPAPVSRWPEAVTVHVDGAEEFGAVLQKFIEPFFQNTRSRLAELSENVSLSEKLYLTIPEAVALSGLPAGIVLRAARAGMGFQPGNKRGWLIRRDRLMEMDIKASGGSAK